MSYPRSRDGSDNPQGHLGPLPAQGRRGPDVSENKPQRTLRSFSSFLIAIWRFKREQVVDEQDAFKVVDLVLEAGCH
jgi:hypothetical protein